jgi:hypothetical protein
MDQKSVGFRPSSMSPVTATMFFPGKRESISISLQGNHIMGGGGGGANIGKELP